MARRTSPRDMIWANLLHLGYNMWADREQPGRHHQNEAYITARPYLRFDESLWRDLLERLAAAGGNMVVIDLGEGVRYRTHPELGVKGSWSPKKLRRELDRARKLGLEPIPKLNFSACHDEWMGPYARMVSTPTYYKVCGDLIDEVTDLFDGPRFFHLGMDEETAAHQRHNAYAVMRQHELWWHDALDLIDRVERRGPRAWVWSDFIWHHHAEFVKQMPRSVMQSNWYYNKSFSRKINYVQAYEQLDAARYEQIPTGSNWTDATNMRDTVRFAKRYLTRKRVAGFLMTPWKPTLEAERARHEQAIDLLGKARQVWER